jgi:hypothetical protein
VLRGCSDGCCRSRLGRGRGLGKSRDCERTEREARVTYGRPLACRRQPAEETSHALSLSSRGGSGRVVGGGEGDVFELVAPGVVFMPLWHPDSLRDVDGHPERFSGYAGIGRRG